MSDSRFDLVRFRGHTIYVKRDDLFSVGESFPAQKDQCLSLTGNKARKLIHYLNGDFPEISNLVSYGSVQSNMLYSLAVLAKIKGWKLAFYVDHIPQSLLSNPRGNYAAALALGADILVAPGSQEKIEGRLERYVREKVLPETSQALYVPEGGAGEAAEDGFIALAAEIRTWVVEARLKNVKIMLPSGTGTSAYYLQKHLPYEVLTCACVGSREYLQQQFSRIANNNEKNPTILPPVVDSQNRPVRYQFGKLYPELYRLWEELQQGTGITFDLLYDPLGWMHLLAYIGAQKGDSLGFESKPENEPEPTMIYIHQGGLLGNETMLQRYERKFWRLSSVDG